MSVAAQRSAAMKAAIHAADPTGKATWVIADLNGDQVPDAAAVVYNDRNGYIKVVLSKADGHYAEFSSNVFYENPSLYNVVLIEHGLLVYHMDGSGGCCSHWANDFKFRFDENGFRLIGVEEVEFSSGLSDEGNVPASYTFGTSANYLSYKVKYWRTSGKRHVNFIRDIEDRHPIYLKAFFDDEHSGPIPEFSGFVTDRFQLESTSGR